MQLFIEISQMGLTAVCLFGYEGLGRKCHIMTRYLEFCRYFFSLHKDVESVFHSSLNEQEEQDHETVKTRGLNKYLESY